MSDQHQHARQHDADQVDARAGRADFAATSQSPRIAATTANPAAGTVVTEMNTPTRAADFDDIRDSIPAAPASSATTNEIGPTWKMKSTSVT